MVLGVAFVVAFGGLGGFGVKPILAGSASLTLSPAQGSYFVDSTFNVSILLNTGGTAINAVDAHLTFPADKIQVVNPTVSQSFIQIWTSGPSYSNTDGTLTFQGGLPSPGIATSAGVVSTIQFRAKAAGSVTIKFTSDSKVLANDGAGTNILTTKSPGSFTIQLPAPAGPTISSPTNPDQTAWYRSRDVALTWETADGSQKFSYALDQNPATVPDETVNATTNQLTTTVKTDGIWYFHLRAQNQTGWGGSSHYSLKIDSTGPASFVPRLDQTTFSSQTRQLAHFTTTDAASGIDHYEVAVVKTNDSSNNTPFFTEQPSPYQLPQLTPGRYQLIVRAFDAAGNSTDGVASFTVVGGTAAFGVGIPFFSNPLVNNIIIGLLAVGLATLAWLWWRRRRAAGVAGRLHQDVANLQELVSEKQGELQELSQVQSSIAAVVDPIKAGGPASPPAVPPIEQPPNSAGQN